MTDAKKTMSHDEKSIEKKIEELEKQLAEKNEQYLRALADYQNLQRRASEEQQRFVRIATATCVQSMLEPFDHLRMASEHLKDKALEMVVRQFAIVFEQEGVKEIDAAGKPFDPKLMEAIEVGDGEKDIVVHVRRPGYMLHDFVLRPAQVEVGKGTTSEEEQAQHKSIEQEKTQKAKKQEK